MHLAQCNGSLILHNKVAQLRPFQLHFREGEAPCKNTHPSPFLRRQCHLLFLPLFSHEASPYYYPLVNIISNQDKMCQSLWVTVFEQEIESWLKSLEVMLTQISVIPTYYWFIDFKGTWSLNEIYEFILLLQYWGKHIERILINPIFMGFCYCWQYFVDLNFYNNHAHTNLD